MDNNEIKCGDIVKVKRETPKDLYNNLPYSFVDMPFFVAEIERDCDNPMYDTFLLRNGSTCLNIHPRWLERWDAKPQPNDHTITIPVKTDFGEDVGFALLDKALELQKKYTELEGEIVRLFDFMNVARNAQYPIALKFDNDLLNTIANSISTDFRPLTEEERKQNLIEIKNLADNLKKQSE